MWVFRYQSLIPVPFILSVVLFNSPAVPGGSQQIKVADDASLAESDDTEVGSLIGRSLRDDQGRTEQNLAGSEQPCVFPIQRVSDELSGDVRHAGDQRREPGLRPTAMVLTRGRIAGLRGGTAEALLELLVPPLAHVLAADDVNDILRDVGGMIGNPLQVT